MNLSPTLTHVDFLLCIIAISARASLAWSKLTITRLWGGDCLYWRVVTQVCAWSKPVEQGQFRLRGIDEQLGFLKPPFPELRLPKLRVVFPQAVYIMNRAHDEVIEHRHAKQFAGA